MRPPTTTRSSSTRRAPTRPATSRVTSRPCSPRASRGSSRSPASPRSAPPTPLPGRRRCCSPTRRPPSCWRRPARPTRSPSPPTPVCRRPTSPPRSRPRSAATSRSSPAPTLIAENQASLADRLRRLRRRSSLIFAFVAVFVGAFIINNTFSITVAQRTREMAMLRAIGASGRQVKRSVLIEAAVDRRPRVGRRPRRRHRCGRRAAAADVGVRVRHARRPDRDRAERDDPLVRRRCDRDRAVGVAARPPGRQDRPDRGAA